MKSVLCIYDSKAETYGDPFVQKTKAVAIRDFADAANDPKSQLHKHAADITLFEVGTWDEERGCVTMYTTKINLGLASEFVREDNVIQMAKDKVLS